MSAKVELGYVSKSDKDLLPVIYVWVYLQDSLSLGTTFLCRDRKKPWGTKDVGRETLASFKLNIGFHITC